VLRSLALAAIVAALMRPAFHRAAGASVVYVLDVSSSVSPRCGWGADWIAQLNGRYQPAQSRFVVFADRAKLLDWLPTCAAAPPRECAAERSACNDQRHRPEQRCSRRRLLRARSQQAHRPADDGVD
jgi:hypothetical protein